MVDVCRNVGRADEDDPDPTTLDQELAAELLLAQLGKTGAVQQTARTF